jgi:DEAD/DEAH box helicase domain-containing protein
MKTVLRGVVDMACAGSVSSLWQQSGRAGRREQASVSIYVAFDGPLDQFFMHQPENLFQRPIERAQVVLANPDLTSPKSQKP